MNEEEKRTVVAPESHKIELDHIANALESIATALSEVATSVQNVACMIDLKLKR